MRIDKKNIAIIITVGVILTSCYWKNWDTIHTTPGPNPNNPASCTVPADSVLYHGAMVFRGSNPVDTGTIMSYSIDVLPIINASCATTAACHGAGASGSAKDYSTYAGVHSDSRGDTVTSTLFAYISPGATDPMPKTGAKLSTCDRNKIRNWIHQGAQNN